MTDTTKHEQQIALEREMIEGGISRFRAAVERARSEGRETDTGAGYQLLRRAVEPLALAIEAFIAEAKSGKPGRHQLSVRYIEQVDPFSAAFIAAKRALDYAAVKVSITDAALAIGSAVELEARFSKFARECPQLWHTLDATVSTHERHRRNVLVRYMIKAGIEWTAWPRSDKVHVGVKLIDLFVQSTGFVFTENVVSRSDKKFKTHIKLALAPSASEWIDARSAQMEESARPQFLPMIVPPVPWTSPVGGGYLTPTVVERCSLVRGAFGRGFFKTYARRAMPAVYEAVNALQATPWRINRRVYDVVDHVWSNDLGLAGIPAQSPLPLPPFPFAPDVDVKALDDEDKKKLREWKHKAHKVHAANAALVSKRLAALRCIKQAERFVDETLYFPCNLDFRGRVYTYPTTLSPQGSDLAKGLLTFAEGKPINDGVAAGWLAIHGANVFGFDKAGLEDRIAWVEERNERIIATANDPMADLWWADADKPWQFLAFIFEWAQFLTTGFGFVSSLPVAMDGTCNGLQHFSAALRDPVGGAAVNLVPADKPSDIYQRVADVVIEKLNNLLVPDDPPFEDDDERLADAWLRFGVNRKTVKRPVMVLPYGGKMYGYVDMIVDHIKERVEGGEASPFGDDYTGAAMFLARVIWSAVGEVVIAARAAMDWLQKCARIAVKEGRPVEWVTPTGFTVKQRYMKLRQREIEAKLDGRRIRPLLTEPTSALDANRNANAVSPNWVHSLDASHLVETVVLARDNGIASFGAVHDSYATLAADANLMYHCLRKAFVSLYASNDVAEMIRRDLGGEALPPPPPKGTLDITQVERSDFFFA